MDALLLNRHKRSLKADVYPGKYKETDGIEMKLFYNVEDKPPVGAAIFTCFTAYAGCYGGDYRCSSGCW